MACVLGYVLYKVLRPKDLTPDPVPAGWNDSDEAQEWDERAAAMRADFGLGAIRQVASKWAASIAALLGILSTVAFVTGPKELKDIGGWEAKVAGGLVLAAAAIAAISLCLAVMAEQGSPQWSENLTGWALKSLTKQRADRSANEFRWSRFFLLVALVLIILATAIAWATALTKKKSDKQSAIVVMAGGAVCGALQTRDGVVSIKSVKSTGQVPENALITLVDSCP